MTLLDNGGGLEGREKVSGRTVKSLEFDFSICYP